MKQKGEIFMMIDNKVLLKDEFGWNAPIKFSNLEEFIEEVGKCNYDFYSTKALEMIYDDLKAEGGDTVTFAHIKDTYIEVFESDDFRGLIGFDPDDVEDYFENYLGGDEEEIEKYLEHYAPNIFETEYKDVLFGEDGLTMKDRADRKNFYSDYAWDLIEDVLSCDFYYMLSLMEREGIHYKEIDDEWVVLKTGYQKFADL